MDVQVRSDDDVQLWEFGQCHLELFDKFEVHGSRCGLRRRVSRNNSEVPLVIFELGQENAVAKGLMLLY
eukprot:1354111-Amphidinium_carterae.1